MKSNEVTYHIAMERLGNTSDADVDVFPREFDDKESADHDAEVLAEAYSKTNPGEWNFFSVRRMIIMDRTSNL